MASGNLKNRIIAGASALTILFTSTFATTFCTIKALSEKDVNLKDQKYVTRDAKSLGVDMDIAKYYNGYYKRFKIEEDKTVIVKCDKDVEGKEKQMIEKVVEYYNKIFSTINEKYKFVIVDHNSQVDEESPVIYIGNKEMYDADGKAEVENNCFNLFDGIYSDEARISIAWQQLEESGDDAYSLYVMFHEFTHVLGLRDVYYRGENKCSEYVDMTTMMDEVADVKSMLYPNDYAILQALYSNEYKKHGDYNEAVKVVKEKINKYTENFYNFYSNMLKEKKEIKKNLGEEKFVDEINFSNIEIGTNCSIKLLENNKYELYVKDNKGNIIEICQGKTIYVDGVLFLKDIVVKNAKNYRKMYDDKLGIKLMLSVYIDRYEQLVVSDNLISYNASLSQKNIIKK